VSRRRASLGEIRPGTLGALVTFRTETIQAGAIDPSTPYVGLEHLEPGTGRWRWVPAGDAAIRSPKGVFLAGDVLYGRLRPNLRKCAVASLAGVCSADIFVLRPHEPALAPLLALVLRSDAFATRVGHLATGANLPRVMARDLLAVPLELPDGPEAARIMAVAAATGRARALIHELDERVAGVERAVADALTIGREPG
jgi:type I restriction enzyme, S subunit